MRRYRIKASVLYSGYSKKLSVKASFAVISEDREKEVKIAGYILAGGKNRRMDGKKKLFLEYEGKAFYEYIVDALAWFPVIYLSVDGTEAYESLNLPMIEDHYPEIGPIGGICSGLEQCEEDALFVTACDTPWIDRESVEMICEAYREHPERITVASCGERIHPLFGIYPKTALPVLRQMIAEKNYRMREVLERGDAALVDLGSDCIVLRNVNTPEEYKKMSQERERKTLLHACSCSNQNDFEAERISHPFFYAISGYKNTGKTTLITRLIPELVKLGLKVAVIKHDGHDFESDVPGTDSWRHQKAGAYGTAVFSGNRVMITKECQGIDETQIAQAFPEADVILIEGLKNSPYPKYICNYPQEELIEARELAAKIKELANEARSLHT
jgi:molybdopterin-guanine dinucleotide biosynthesis protein MobB